MNTSICWRIPVIALAALALTACPLQKQTKPQDKPPVNTGPFHVNAATGADANTGTQASPFKTVTHALGVAKSGSTVQVAPGTYNAANGETFPMMVPAGVLLIGDEANKGGGAGPTSILGGGLAPGAAAGTVAVALVAATGSTVAGFTITSNSNSFTARRGVMLSGDTVTLRNNTITGATHDVGVYVDASTSHLIAGNRIVDNGGSGMGSGIGFAKGGTGSKVENNVITGNAFGIEYDVAGGDLGGGSAGSAGGNIISCNTQDDLVNRALTPITISAANNLWDHPAPTLACTFAGDDICDVNAGTANAATVVATPAAQAANSCATSVILYVDASASDANPGTQDAPFKTITHAMTVATSGATVQVVPGVYDVLSGETFPIVVPDGVILIGDEANKGGGGSPTSILGGGHPTGAPATVGVAVLPGTGTTIAGFTITNNNPAFAARRGLMLGNSNVTLRNNTVTGATHLIGVQVDASTNHVISGNRIVGNGPSSGTGIGFISGGAGSKLENNIITGNGFGIDYETTGGDLGGGTAGSAGGNVISCNALGDLVAFASAPITISAANNLWDHSPPIEACTFSGDDICDANAGTANAATIVATPSALAASPCP